jgi:hypothetical protein
LGFGHLGFGGYGFFGLWFVETNPVARQLQLHKLPIPIGGHAPLVYGS